MTFSKEISSYLDRHGITSMVPRAFLFDMDGTLYDSMSNHAEAWHRMASEAGLESTLDEFFMYEGSTGAATINQLFQRARNRNATDAEIKRLYARKAEIFRGLPAPEVMPGALALVNYVRSLTWHPHTVLVTGSGQMSLLDRLNRNFQGAFPADMRITASDVHTGKPDPEPYLKGMALAHALPDQCIAIENAPLGIMSAHRSGAFTVAVTTGPIPADEMWKAGADVVFPSMEKCAEQFPALISRLISDNKTYSLTSNI